MEKINLKDLQKWTKAEKISGEDTRFIDSISTDTRTITRGQFFIPLKGQNFDGHHYIQQAVSRGACGFVYERGFPVPDLGPGPIIFQSRDNLSFLQRLAFHYIRRIKPVVVGITGSVGKTTTKDMLVSVLKRKHKVCYTPKNYNNEIGVPKAVLDIGKDTKYFVAELAMRKKGQIRQLAEMIDVDIAVITAIGESHLEFFNNISEIALAKAEIASFPGKKKGVLFLNHDSPWADFIKQRVNCRIIEFGKNNSLDYNFIGQQPDVYGKYSFIFCKKDSRIAHVRLNIAGAHNMVNGCAAAAVSDWLGIDPDDISRGLENAAVEENRMAVFEKDAMIIINDCYNASPISVASALDTLQHIAHAKSARSVAILSDMLELGQNAAKMHCQVGMDAKQKNIDCLLAFGTLAKHICKGFGAEKSVYFEDKQQMVKHIKGYLKKGDVVLLKGSRANKMEEIIKQI